MSSFVFYTIPMLTLLDRHGIHVILLTLADLAVSAFPKPSTLALTIPSASSLRNHPSTHEISTTYSCAPYMPSDFPASSYYDKHFLLERRRVIKCPSLPLQLAACRRQKSRKHSHALACSKAYWGTRVRDGVWVPIDLTLHNTHP
jgi:hypothetical protein